MKRAILILVLSIISVSIRAQKIEKLSVDPITGDTSITTKLETISNKLGLVINYLACNVRRISLSKSNTRGYFLSFYINTFYDKGFSIPKDNKASIKFTDGTILEVTSSFDSNSEYYHTSGSQIGTSYIGGSSGSTAHVSYNLTSSDIQVLKSKEISFIRIETSVAPFDYEIKKKNSEVIKKHLELITSR